VNIVPTFLAYQFLSLFLFHLTVFITNCPFRAALSSRDRRRARDTATRDARPDVDGATRRDARATRTRDDANSGDDDTATRTADGVRERGDAAAAGFVAQSAIATATRRARRRRART